MNPIIPIERTDLLFYEDTYRTSASAKLLAVAEDERGLYVLLDATICYPQSGGQPCDHGVIRLGDQTYPVTDARYFGPVVRHYSDDLAPLRGREGETVEIAIDRDRRLLHAAYHSAGHWLAAVVEETLAMPVTPVRGHHFPDSAYISFEDDGDVDWNTVIEQIPMALLLDRQSDLSIVAEIPKPSGDGAAPDGPGGRMARLVRIGSDYRAVGCGGTHLASVREIGFVCPERTKRKGGQTRLYYHVA